MIPGSLSHSPANNNSWPTLHSGEYGELIQLKPERLFSPNSVKHTHVEYGCCGNSLEVQLTRFQNTVPGAECAGWVRKIWQEKNSLVIVQDTHIILSWLSVNLQDKQAPCLNMNSRGLKQFIELERRTAEYAVVFILKSSTKHLTRLFCVYVSTQVLQ